MKAPKGQIARGGTVHFGDASISVWEEGLSAARNTGGFEGEKAWEQAFKRQVFARIVQTLNRLGWTVSTWEDAERFKAIALNRRSCSKGDLKGELSVSGRHIEFSMWQGVNTPTRPDHGGRYESNLEGCMPYVIRLEMERTRRRIRDYLCGVFTGYTFKPGKRSIYRKPLEHTAWEIIQQHYAESWHFKGDMAAYLKKNGYAELPAYNCKSADGQHLEHGQRVWTTDWHGRWVEGVAYYNINNMWWVLLGKYDYTNKACFDLHTKPPADLRTKQNQDRRRKRLEGELAKAATALDFDRAKVLKGILFPTNEPLFHIVKQGTYFRPGCSGYTSNPVDAGRYTKAELKPYASDIADGELKAVPVKEIA